MYGLNVVIYIFIFSKCMFHGDLELVSFSLHLSLSLSLSCAIDMFDRPVHVYQYMSVDRPVH